ncbi:MAG TPA: hypothetical protein VHC97_23680 [Thermoanaerobaculia bacterium]|jgi:hypothetical protein|nr:hypothetical protein [Thermoanaerobaculia bacterium]
MRLQTSWLLTALSLVAVVAVPAAAEIRPLGAPFRVNRTDDFKQENPVAAFSGSGTALVVWQNDQNGIRGIFQRLDGTALSSQLSLVANETLGSRNEGLVTSRRDPAVAFLPNGQFLLAWTEEKAYVRASPFYEDRQVQDQDVFVQRFDASGAAAGARYRVNNAAAGLQTVPKIALLANGNAFVVWKTSTGGATPQGGIGGRLISATGQPVGADFRVSEEATADHAAVAAGRNGILVAWDSTVNGQVDVFARLYETSGRASGPAFRVNASPAGTQRWPAVVAGSDGNFLVSWQSHVISRADVHIFGQFLSPVGGFLGNSFLISRNDGTQLAPALAATKTGFVASWLEGYTLGYGIQAVELTNLGARVGDEVTVVPLRARKNYRQSIAADGKGGILVPWETNNGRAQVIVARGLHQ